MCSFGFYAHEGWDANSNSYSWPSRIWHPICEQVVGRALRRLSYDRDPDTGLFRTEYADIMGIDGPNFSDAPRVAKPQLPREVISVQSMSPERDHLEIEFPRVLGYSAEIPPDQLSADFSDLEPYIWTVEKVGAAEVTMQGIVGKSEKLTLGI